MAGPRRLRTSMSLALAGLLGACFIGENPLWNANVGGGQNSATGTTDSPAESATSTTQGMAESTGDASASASSSSTGAGSSESTGPAPTLGQPCESVPVCDQGEMCCRSPQCFDTCLVFCGIDQTVCPEGFLCAHGYCLLECEANDADCVTWPGFTCEHGGTACENLPKDGGGSSSGG